MEMTYNYEEAVASDVRNYIEENLEELSQLDDRDEIINKINDDAWVDDSITGNGSGSYTFNRRQALEYVKDNMELMVKAYKEFDSMDKLIKDLENGDYEAIDVCIRCYSLSGAIEEVVDEYFEF